MLTTAPPGLFLLLKTEVAGLNICTPLPPSFATHLPWARSRCFSSSLLATGHLAVVFVALWVVALTRCCFFLDCRNCRHLDGCAMMGSRDPDFWCFRFPPSSSSSSFLPHFLSDSLHLQLQSACKRNVHRHSAFRSCKLARTQHFWSGDSCCFIPWFPWLPQMAT